MALFETMRENTKLILWITVVAFVLLIFLAWGADFATRSNKSQAEAGVLAKVNGERVYAQEYSDAYEQARQLYEPQLDGPPDEAFFNTLRASTWTQMIDRKLIQQAAREHGIVVTDREVATALLYNPPPHLRSNPSFFNEQGQFDMQRYQSWLAGTNTAPLEREYRDLVAQEKLRMLMLAGVAVSEDEVREAWLESNQQVNLAYVQVPHFLAVPDHEVDDATLERYLGEHREEMRMPERVRIEFVSIEKGPSREDSLEAQAEMTEVSQELRKGEAFDVLVKSFSQAPRTHWGDADAPYLTREELRPPEVAQAAFTLPVGTMSDVISSADGLHMLTVIDRKSEANVEKVKLAEIYIPIRMSYETNYAMQERALDLVDSTGTGDFRAAAQDVGLDVQDTGLIDPSGFVPGLGNLAAAKEFVRTAHVTQTSRPIEGPDAWFVLYLAERQPAGDAPLSEIRRRVQSAYIQNQRKQAALEHAQRILDLVRSGTPMEMAARSDSIARFARADGVTRQGFVRGMGREPKVTGVAFAATAPGLVPEVISGTQGAYVIDVLTPPVADEQGFAAQREQLRGQLVQAKQNRVLNEWLRQLREKAQIEDFRPVLSSM
jgi:peptidyl-prolyl cis-trans isomerase D